jgi:hypothetical protein
LFRLLLARVFDLPVYDAINRARDAAPCGDISRGNMPITARLPGIVMLQASGLSCSNGDDFWHIG